MRNVGTNIGAAFEVPVLLHGFNRPLEFCQFILSLREISAKNVYFSLDERRFNSNSDNLKVAMVRQLKILFNWECELHPRFLNENLGCKLAISTCISWFFENVNEGIILKDDSLLNKDFDFFCELMFDRNRYSDDTIYISGTPFVPIGIVYRNNGFFSALQDFWGWAIWKRARSFFNIYIEYHDKNSETEILNNYFGSKKLSRWFHRYFEDSKSSTYTLFSTYRTFSLITRKALSIDLRINLVTNIGFKKEVTHGKDKSFQLYNTFHRESLPNLPDHLEIQVFRNLDRAGFLLIRSTDPELNILGIIRIRIKRISREFLRFLQSQNLMNVQMNSMSKSKESTREC